MKMEALSLITELYQKVILQLPEGFPNYWFIVWRNLYTCCTQVDKFHSINILYFYASLVLLALSALSKEIDDLVVQANTTFYNPLLFYGEGFGNDTIDDGEAAKAISRILPTLQHVNMNELILILV